MPLLDIFEKKREKVSEFEKPKIIADKREKNSMVISELIHLGADVEMKFLDVADFLAKGTAVERKTIPDFINSMINKRLARQLEEIKQYPNHLLIIEGTEDRELYSDDGGGVNANALRGFLLSILLKYKIPVLFTKNSEDTAKFLFILAKKQDKEESLRAIKKSRSSKEQLQYILEGFPGIGPKTAKKLLKKYQTLKAIVNAPLEELKKEIGVKADIFKILDESYGGF